MPVAVPPLTHAPQSLVSHGGPVNDLRMHPLQPSWLLSCSRDHSLRLWHVRTGVLALVLAGDGGHRNEVISCDWHASERCTCVSSGMDGCVKLWAPTDSLFAALEPALLPPPPGAKPAGGSSDAPPPPPPPPLQPRVRFLQTPRFSTHRVHSNFVDCVRFFGDAVLSKSVENSIRMWLPDVRRAGVAAQRDRSDAPRGRRRTRRARTRAMCGTWRRWSWRMRTFGLRALDWTARAGCWPAGTGRAGCASGTCTSRRRRWWRR
jgi:hypothetical protein